MNDVLDKIIVEPDPILRTISDKVHPENFGEVVTKLVARMRRTLDAEGGIGLAAIQIGVPWRVIIVKVDGVHYEMVNPVVTRTLNRFVTRKEGCLSVPRHKWGNVTRPAKCEITWQTVDGEERSEGFSGLLAQVFLHEIDHLDGVIILDKIIR